MLIMSEIINYICNQISRLINTGEYGNDEQIAKKLGCTRPQISRIRGRNRREFDILFLLRLCKIFGKSLNYFLPPNTHKYLHSDLHSMPTNTPTRNVQLTGCIISGPNESIQYLDTNETYPFPSIWLDEEDSDRFYLLRIETPFLWQHGISDGDLLLIDDRPIELQQGDLVLLTNGEKAQNRDTIYVRQIWDTGRQWLFTPAIPGGPLTRRSKTGIKRITRLIRVF